ncbi:DsbA family protein [Staphylococcus pettenkoferi]|uniref:DsbA family protein n=1 Tax=Staphylococcus pettenkoferi TaxID=170573 RepID=UPI0021B443C1|nr:DsbA family protein [Staphylococcus pettenkoferi]MCY1593558.1 DsbA family protein [Staphylococcus pettenkoferi]MCY1598290.1 DsbA family protein [Staphylococcus pettenkoferi]MCY1610371.1 DsbA family protein [Staphylococcus pettenkoferi]MCY1625848.1 DsbA family protein [Staphylococcus pettenkoferi]
MQQNLLLPLLVSCSNNHQNKKVTIVEYGDYKCPYCKDFDTKVMPKLEKEYIDKGKVDYSFVNLSFLGKDSIIGSRASHAVKNIAPKHYLEFHHKIYKEQPNNENKWITYKKVDSIIDHLSIKEKEKKKIKKNYKQKNSKAYKDAIKDKKTAKKEKVEMAPTVTINGKMVEDPLDKNDLFKKLNKELKK